MGNPAFYYTPTDGATIETVDLGEALQDLQEEPSGLRQDSFAGDGSLYTHRLGESFKVRIMLERFGTAGSSSLERQLSTMLNHLQRGGVVYFTRDTAKCWATMFVGGWARAGTAITTAGNLLTGLSASGTLASGDEVVIETEEPIGYREYRGVTSVSGGALTLSEGLTYEYGGFGSAWYTIARWRDCYPGLYLLADDARGNKVKSDARRNWTLDLDLYWSPASFIGALRALTTARFGNEALTSIGVPGVATAPVLPFKTSTAHGIGMEALVGRIRLRNIGTRTADQAQSHTGTVKV